MRSIKFEVGDYLLRNGFERAYYHWDSKTYRLWCMKQKLVRWWQVLPYLRYLPNVLPPIHEEFSFDKDGDHKHLLKASFKNMVSYGGLTALRVKAWDWRLHIDKLNGKIALMERELADLKKAKVNDV